MKRKKVDIRKLFSNSRSFTKKESKLYEESLNEMFEDTGKKVFDIKEK